ncbi:hypothetical protein ADUPG1_007570, partial [Aduncisulcus paluster]
FGGVIMQAAVQITERHILTYRAIRDYIYHNRKSPDLLTIGNISGIKNDKEVLSVLRDLKDLGYLLYDGPQLTDIHLHNA